MAQALPISVVVGSATHVFQPAQTQNGKNPSLFVKQSTTGVLDFGDILKHNVSTGPKNKNVKFSLSTKSIEKVDGVDMVARVLGTDVNFSWPKSSSTLERTTHVDTVIAALTKIKQDIISAEVYF